MEYLERKQRKKKWNKKKSDISNLTTYNFVLAKYFAWLKKSKSKYNYLIQGLFDHVKLNYIHSWLP